MPDPKLTTMKNQLASGHLVFENDPMRMASQKLTGDDINTMRDIKAAAHDLYVLIDDCGHSRELSLAKTKIEEACMWAVKHVTGPKVEGVAVGSGVPHTQPLPEPDGGPGAGACPMPEDKGPKPGDANDAANEMTR